MKTTKYIALLTIALINIACNKDAILDNKSDLKKYNLILDVSQTNYDNIITKSDYQWSDGALLHIMFNNKDNSIQYPGTATYNAESGSWQLTPPQGELHVGDSTLCSIVYIENNCSENPIVLNTSNAIYEDINAKYFINGNTLSIKADLTPKTARLRFAGQSGTRIKLFGIAHYNLYSPYYNLFGVSTEELELTVTDNGYTPYIHVFFPNTVKRLELTDSNNNIFVFKCSDKHLQPGVSGYFNIPVESNKGGWTMYNSVQTHKLENEDIEFKMIYVKWIEGSFYIAETEATQQLWKAVMNQNPASHQYGELELPIESIEANSIKVFTEAIAKQTGYPFTLPTFAQWFHAAKGGIKSKGYLYSGSNNLDDVAWYKNNSGDTTHAVKTKIPNELGLYDMNGNVTEYVFSPDYSNYDYAKENWYTDKYGGDCTASNERKDNSNEYFALIPEIRDYGWKFTGFRLCLNL